MVNSHQAYFGADQEGNSLKITVIGLGYVGIVAASCLAIRGHRVTGVDVDPERVKILQSGRLPLYEPGLDQIKADAIERELLRFAHTSDLQ